MKVYNRIINSPLAYRIFSGTSWTAFSTAMSRGTLMLSMIITARILGKSDFGELGMIQSSIIMFGSLSGLGMGLTATKHIAEYRISNPDKIGSIISMTVIVTLICAGLLATTLYYLSPWFASRILAAPHLNDALKIGTFNIVIIALTSTFGSILIGFESYKELGFINTLSGVTMVPAITGGAYYFGVNGALWGIVMGGSFWVLLAANASYRRMKNEKITIPLHIKSYNWRLLIDYGLPAVIIEILNSAGNWAGSAYLVNHVNYAEMGIFNAANQWFSILLFIPSVIAISFLPILSDYAGKQDFPALKKILKSGLKMNIYICIPIAIAVTITSPWIMKLYGDGYEEGYPTLMLIAFAAMACSLQNLLGNFLAATNQMVSKLFCDLVWACSYLAMVYYMVNTGYGAFALGVSALVAYALKTLLTGYIVMWRLRARRSDQCLENQYR